ncbi:TetR/AcrR family transcriptional regulator [Thalassotalea marina]|uniref:TetR family transcriptional regulator n=1 Tax=Thalassotalea marina TaxID=1673741 RepID=A0A919EGW6_9GAMM|nr:TetR/AcrR family transcriptional regulator [Thalassotalea marina]GHF77887.1 TetR family transcriptional regulator [Thalassotalea marina]
MRSAEFNREQVLRAAIKAFMVKGYTKTSMQDLKQATGLHPGSIYCAFENKQGLLLAAIEQYNKDKADEFKQYFDNQSSVLTGLKHYLEDTVTACTQGGTEKVCLSQKALNELAQQEPLVEQYISNNMLDWQQGFVDMFAKAQQLGELNNARSPLQRAQSLVMGIYGLRSYAHTHPESETMCYLANQLFEDVCR